MEQIFYLTHREDPNNLSYTLKLNGIIAFLITPKNKLIRLFPDSKHPLNNGDNTVYVGSLKNTRYIINVVENCVTPEGVAEGIKMIFPIWKGKDGEQALLEDLYYAY